MQRISCNVYHASKYIELLLGFTYWCDGNSFAFLSKISPKHKEDPGIPVSKLLQPESTDIVINCTYGGAISLCVTTIFSLYKICIKCIP